MIKPLKDNVLIKFEEGQDISKTGIIIAHKEEDRPRVAKVLAIGEDVTQVNVNDNVIVNRYIGNQIFIDNKEHIILKEREILAKLED